MAKTQHPDTRERLSVHCPCGERHSATFAHYEGKNFQCGRRFLATWSRWWRTEDGRLAGELTLVEVPGGAFRTFRAMNPVAAPNEDQNPFEPI